MLLVNVIGQSDVLTILGVYIQSNLKWLTCLYSIWLDPL